MYSLSGICDRIRLRTGAPPAAVRRECRDDGRLSRLGLGLLLSVGRFLSAKVKACRMRAPPYQGFGYNSILLWKIPEMRPCNPPGVGQQTFIPNGLSSRSGARISADRHVFNVVRCRTRSLGDYGLQFNSAARLWGFRVQPEVLDKHPTIANSWARTFRLGKKFRIIL